MIGQPINKMTEYKGNSHENGGVPLGQTGNEVEGGETRKDDFIYSDRILVPETRKTFAEVSKSIEKKYKDRPNDIIANRSKKRELDRLADQQESLKQEIAPPQPEQQPQMQEQGMGQQGAMPQGQPQMGMPIQQAMGGQLGKKYYGGGFDDRGYNLTNTNIPNRGLGMPQPNVPVPMPNMAGSAPLYNTQEDLSLLQPRIPTTLGSGLTQPSIQRTGLDYQVPDNTVQGNINPISVQAKNTMGVLPSRVPSKLGQLDAGNPEVLRQNIGGTEPLSDAQNTGTILGSTLDNASQFLNGNQEGLVNAGKVGLTQMGSLYDVGRGLAGGSPEYYDRVQAAKLQRLDPSRSIQQQREAGNQLGTRIRQAGGQGLGQYLNNMNQAATGTQKGVANTIAQYDNQNTGIANQEAMNRQQVQSQNIGIDFKQNDINARERDEARNTLQRGLTGTSHGLGTAFNDAEKRAQEKWLIDNGYLNQANHSTVANPEGSGYVTAQTLTDGRQIIGEFLYDKDGKKLGIASEVLGWGQ